jgi:hypothetical protein
VSLRPEAEITQKQTPVADFSQEISRGQPLGGYQVLKKWLSYREHALLGRDLTPEEARYVTQTVRRLAALRLLEPGLDGNYEAGK